MHVLARTLLVALLALSPYGAAWAADAPGAAASRPHPAKPAFPQIDLPERKSHGQRAIELLGNRLPDVAAWYGKSADEFRAMLLADRRLKIDKKGRLFVEDELETPLPSTPAPSAASSALSGALLPLDQTFLLHSRVGAKRTIYLNFRGAALGNTAWNGSGGTLTALPFDIDGVPYTFSNAELERIQYIWQRVVEDFAPFDVDVTTEAPAGDVLTRSGSTDQVFGTTVVVTSRSGVYSCSCGGVAYIGIFDDTSDYYKPALVFYDALGSGSEKYVAEAISHEAGHNMGLGHDGSATAGYYQGHGSGATGWAPIMGVGYYQPLAQWSKGEYAGANNLQDDYVVMASNGLPVRLDDHGDTRGSASALQASTVNGMSTLSGSGVIARPGDIDMFSFSSGAGTLSLNVSLAARSPNLDLLIELRDGNGVLLASANPVDALAASLSFNVPASASYYLGVQGVGKGDALGTGYSSYGSVGQYEVSGSAPAAAGLPPVAALSATPNVGTAPLAVDFSSSGSSDPDNSIVGYEWTFGDGAVQSGATASHAYASAGNYTAVLKLTDSSGLTASKSVSITASAAVASTPMRVADIAMSLVGSRSARAVAAVTVKDSSGNSVPGATVSGNWSGVISGSSSVVAGSNGVASLQSPNTKNRGVFQFTVTGVTLPNYSYQPALNTETSDAITR
ncbi:MAG: PKD domain-containing protein [Rubrivivax sp.]